MSDYPPISATLRQALDTVVRLRGNPVLATECWRLLIQQHRHLPRPHTLPEEDDPLGDDQPKYPEPSWPA